MVVPWAERRILVHMDRTAFIAGQPVPPEILGRLRESPDGLEAPDRWARGLREDGYVLLRGALPTGQVAAARRAVLERLAARSKTKAFVELLPLPSGPKDLNRIRPLFRWGVFQRYYRGSSPVVTEYLEGPMAENMRDPNYLNAELEKLAKHLEKRQRYVYASREKDHTWEGKPEEKVEE